MSVNTSNSKNNKTDLKSPAPPNIQTIVPMSRIKTIMKSSPEISIINQDTLYDVTLATVIIKYILISSYFIIIIYMLYIYLYIYIGTIY